MNSIEFLKEFNSHLRNEVHELKSEKSELKGVISTLLERNQDLKDKLKKEKKRSQNFFTEMLRAQCECDDLNHEIERLKGENAALKINRSIYTVSKRETELERQLESERMRADELSEKNETLAKRYEETQNTVTELTDENTMLKVKLEHFHTIERRAQFECARANELEAKLEKYEKEKQEETDNDNT